MANIGQIKYGEDVNTDGISVSIYFTGCEFNCKNCFNKELQDFNYGYIYSISKELEIFKYIEDNVDYIDNLAILGGEPLHPTNINTTRGLVSMFKHKFPDKKIWVWTGYNYDTIQKELHKDDIIFKNIDILIDGLFIEELYNRNLKYKGSSNQRIIDVKQSLEKDEIILYKDLNENRNFQKYE